MACCVPGWCCAGLPVRWRLGRSRVVWSAWRETSAQNRSFASLRPLLHFLPKPTAHFCTQMLCALFSARSANPCARRQSLSQCPSFPRLVGLASLCALPSVECSIACRSCSPGSGPWYRVGQEGQRRAGRCQGTRCSLSLAAACCLRKLPPVLSRFLTILTRVLPVRAAVQGKGFRHEKTKKKRGTYRGGALETGVRSIKFT